MDNLTQEIKKALYSIPQHIREVISRTPWQTKLEEITVKYNLTSDQSHTLLFEVMLVLVAITPEDDLVENIKIELGVSDILAEQLADEIHERIFIWLRKLYLEKEKESNIPQENVVGVLDANPLDIPPSNLPGEMIGEESVIPAPTLEQTLVPEIHVIPPQPLKDTHILTSQAGPTPQTTPTEAPKPSFIASKLTQTTKPIQPLPEIPKTYTIDPYREPIE